MGLFAAANALPTPAAALLPSFAFNRGILSFPSSLPASYGLEGLKAWYGSADPLHPAIFFATGMSVVVWLLGEITGNVSQVDRLWTFLPLVYSVHFTFWPKWTGNGPVDERMLLVLGLQLLWSARLTTNTYRRGFFNPNSEDYRWEIVRARIPDWQFKLMNLVFIAFIQNALLMAAELPQYVLLTLSSATFRAKSGYTPPPLGTADYALSALFVLTLCVEMVADNQQQRYQHFKINARSLEKKKNGGELMTESDKGKVARGFVTFGLWSWSRHPNFACEQFTWYILYAFTVVPFLPAKLTLDTLTHHVLQIATPADALAFGKSVQGLLWNYAVWSPLTMSMLFYASTGLTEEISGAKYPLYAEYQKRVGMFWPPITFLKATWLFVTGRKGKVDDIVFGGASKAPATKKDKAL